MKFPKSIISTMLLIVSNVFFMSSANAGYYNLSPDAVNRNARRIDGHLVLAPVNYTFRRNASSTTEHDFYPGFEVGYVPACSYATGGAKKWTTKFGLVYSVAVAFPNTVIRKSCSTELIRKPNSVYATIKTKSVSGKNAWIVFHGFYLPLEDRNGRETDTGYDGPLWGSWEVKW